MVLGDNFVNYVYINNINILSSQINSSQTTLNLTLFPGTNLIDIYCQNHFASNPAGLIFYVIHKTTGQLLCKSDASVKLRMV